MDKELKEIIEYNPKVGELYNNVKQKIELQNKQLYIILNTSGSRRESLGYTEECERQIVISVDTSLLDNKEKLIAVLIHELGEADYIACKLPKLTSQEGDFEDESVKLIREILSHNHIIHIVNKYELNDEIQKLGITLKKCSCSADKSLKAIITIHNIMTYFWDENVKYDSDIKTYVQKIKEILDETDTLNNDIDIIEQKYKQIIDIISKELYYKDKLCLTKR